MYIFQYLENVCYVCMQSTNDSVWRVHLREEILDMNACVRTRKPIVIQKSRHPFLHVVLRETAQSRGVGSGITVRPDVQKNRVLRLPFDHLVRYLIINFIGYSAPYTCNTFNNILKLFLPIHSVSTRFLHVQEINISYLLSVEVHVWIPSNTAFMYPYNCFAVICPPISCSPSENSLCSSSKR